MHGQPSIADGAKILWSGRRPSWRREHAGEDHRQRNGCRKQCCWYQRCAL